MRSSIDTAGSERPSRRRADLPAWLLFVAAALPLAWPEFAAAQDQVRLKPADKSVATGAAAAGKAGGPMLTRDELRDCMKRQADLEKRRVEFERNGAELERDKTALVESGQALKSALEMLDRSNVDAVAAYVAKVGQRDAAVDAWNARNAQRAGAAETFNADQRQWQEACANRRYREDDELAIKRGR